MPPTFRKRVRLALAFPSGVFSLPPLGFGFYLLACWVRIHTTNVYYVDYPYLRTAVVFIWIGLLSLFCTLFSAIRRSFFGMGFAIPLCFGLATMVYIPDGTPHIQRSMITDSNYLSDVNSFFRVWYERHHSFPKDEAEFLDALGTGPAAWQGRVSSPPRLSDYAKGGIRLPYEIIVIQNASGPRMDNLAEKPGVIYYCVASDQQRFWVTMTGLHDDIARSASLKRVADRPNLEPWLITAAGKDYPIRR